MFSKELDPGRLMATSSDPMLLPYMEYENRIVAGPIAVIRGLKRIALSPVFVG